MGIPKEFIKMIEDDIIRIDSAIKCGTGEDRWDLFREMDGKYQVCIDNFYEGMWLSIPKKNVLRFSELKKYPDYVIDNLKMVKSKLIVFRYGQNASASSNAPTTQVNVTTNVNLNVTFEQVRSQVENMTSLTDEQTREVLDRINEIETICEENGSKKYKWEKAKPVLAWLADKSFDVGMALLPLLLKMGE